MNRDLSVRRALPGDYQRIAERLVDDPRTWLPRPARRRGLDRWTVTLAAGPVRRSVACHVDLPWRVRDALWRSITWEPVSERADFLPVTWLLPGFDGQIGVLQGDAGTSLEFRGSYTPPVRGIGAVADAAGLHRVAQSTANWFADQVAHHLTTQPAPTAGGAARER